MSRSMHGARHGILVGAARQLAKDACLARAELDLHHPDREFFLGVEAAAEELVHPELPMARSENWPGTESTAFREGYLRTKALLAAAMTVDLPRVRLPLPVPAPARR